ncbi:MAG: DUF1616 domain-containing protein [Thermoprotei archaeon]
MVDRDTLTLIDALAVIAIVLIIVHPYIPTSTEPFSELGLLGPTMKISDYPTTVVAGQPIKLYVYVGNHEGIVELYQVAVKLGNLSTTVNSTTPAQAPTIATYMHTLGNNQTWIFPLNLTLNTTGHDKLIVELWMYNLTTNSFQYTGIWNQLYINVTKT